MTHAFQNEAAAIVTQMTLTEKLDLICGNGLWRTTGVPRQGLPSLLMVDGSNGLRVVPDQISQNAQNADLGAFLDAVETTDDPENRDDNVLLGKSVPATCFPALSVLGNSWDIALAYEIGTALAIECRAAGAQILLGPGINLRRSPLAGRGFEYFSEDPILTGEMAAAVIRGLQEHGVGASLKHFACNNSEVERISMDSIVEPRALHELYLLGFERAIARSNPWTVMTSYNRLNGIQTSQNPWLLRGVLRKRWHYDGTIMSDWHGIQDLPAAVTAGNDLDMPFNAARLRRLENAVSSGNVPVAALDEACTHIAALTLRIGDAQRRLPVSRPDFAAHHDLARKAASRACILLSNQNDILPLAPQSGKRLLIIGTGAVSPEIQGAGSAAVRPIRCDIPLDCLRATAPEGVSILWEPGWSANGDHDTQRQDSALAAARTAETVIVFASTPPCISGENADRPDLNLCPAHDRLIAELTTIHDRVVVVLTHPDAVVLPWADNVQAILSAGYAGAGFGQAVADLLFGHTNPSGKTSVTWPVRVEDCPAFLGYPGEQGTHLYREGIFVGYRFFDIRRIQPLFPFGHGLSYTSFTYDTLELAEGVDGVAVRFTLSNTGVRAGWEVCQLYLGRAPDPLNRALPHHPLRALKGFATVYLEPGESRVVNMTLDRRDLAYFDTVREDWTVPTGTVSVEIGASSRDIRLSAPLHVTGDARPARWLDLHTPPGQALEVPGVQENLVAWLAEVTGQTIAETETRLAPCSRSFLGIYDTLCWSFGPELDETRLSHILNDANTRSGANPPGHLNALDPS
ncbi:beta-glucosidase family protein [Acetobacter sp.]|jgi:beta-glucosidase|uniref:beta-glucosidase family protein n=1 Tax=Acetobacter sp. TaxID=440 RepID=UPI0025C26D17|nr:glycoside hydrolase family 3 C-terminal domain-containing protein [Acetobacter sp.]MCH4089669.1 glycoside hydrolase family 3 C-terminal domain-containing protein [Acetobacter sp.]MCI1300649.1 glycoside hydrolase family 3 C-terminal domain-containing protein [Acetobacter sp.]MCI1317043.1 glycoside hydrolase family 3 C-terminal domain-containing protein [Acetobacter sp.]